MATEELWQNIEDRMRKSVEALKRELVPIRTGHASPALVENIKVEYGGVPLPLNQVASISAPAARMLVVQPWDRTALGSIEKGILKSDIGLTPINDGNVIRLNIPPLSEERRQELIKLVRARVEHGRIAIRNIRRDALDNLKEMEKNKELSKDELKRATDRLQKVTDTYISEVERVGRDKEAELAEV